MRLMKSRSLLKRVYEMAALLALLNVLVLGGVVAAAVATKSVTGEKLERMMDILREQEPAPEEEEDTSAEAEKPTQAASVIAADDASAQSQVSEEVMRREAARVKEELDQQLALVQRAVMVHSMKSEEFEHRQAEAAKQEQDISNERDEAGFTKMVEIYNGLSPKVAVEMLLSMPEPDDAARILLAMDGRKAKKLVEAAKKINRMDTMQDVLQRVREVAPRRSDELEEE